MCVARLVTCARMRPRRAAGVELVGQDRPCVGYALLGFPLFSTISTKHGRLTDASDFCRYLSRSRVCDQGVVEIVSMELTTSARLTDQQKAFVRAIISGMDKSEAGREAGYKSDYMSSIVASLLRQPQILAAIQIGLAKELACAAPIALKLLKDVVAGEKYDPRLRVVCAKTILDRAGHIAPKAAAPGAAGVLPLNEMSMADLRALADKLEGELAGRAKEVTSATAAPRKAQTIEDIM